MDVALRHWNEENKKVEIRYIDQCRTYRASFLNSIKYIDKSNIIQVSVDGQSVNMKLFTELEKTLEEVKFPNLIDIGTCRVHVKHDAL